MPWKGVAWLHSQIDEDKLRRNYRQAIYNGSEIVPYKSTLLLRDYVRAIIHQLDSNDAQSWAAFHKDEKERIEGLERQYSRKEDKLTSAQKRIYAENMRNKKGYVPSGLRGYD